MITILFSPYFIKKAKKIPKSLQSIVIQETELFRENPTEKSLRVHALRGKLQGHFSFSLTSDYRILFRWKDAKTVIFEDIGTHAIYR